MGRFQYTVLLNHTHRRKVLILWILNSFLFSKTFFLTNAVGSPCLYVNLHIVQSGLMRICEKKISVKFSIFEIYLTTANKFEKKSMYCELFICVCEHVCILRSCMCICINSFSLILRSTFSFDGLFLFLFFFFDIFTDWMRLITTSIQICDYKFHCLTVNSFYPPLNCRTIFNSG